MPFGDKYSTWGFGDSILTRSGYHLDKVVTVPTMNVDNLWTPSFYQALVCNSMHTLLYVFTFTIPFCFLFTLKNMMYRICSMDRRKECLLDSEILYNCIMSHVWNACLELWLIWSCKWTLLWTFSLGKCTGLCIFCLCLEKKSHVKFAFPLSSDMFWYIE